MEKEIKIEELNGMELLKLIYEELKNTRTELNEKIDRVYKELNEKIDTVYKELNEKINNVHKELKEEIKIKFDYLDEKIDNTKNSLIAEIAEELNEISLTTTKLINDTEKKIETEIEDRKVDVSKIKDFNRIIINDIRGRVSILEEETEKYNLK